MDTSMEPEGNIRKVCKECADKMRAETQRHLPPLSELVGKHVKRAFSDGEKVEHMWVEVDSVNEGNRTLVGFLDNSPAMVGNVRCGDEVIFYADEIEEVLE